MEPISYCDFLTGYGIDNYARKAKNNIVFFEQMFGNLDKVHLGMSQPSHENQQLLEKIIQSTQLPEKKVIAANYADELLNISSLGFGNLGCTSIGHNGVIGQTMDLFTVDLAIVREKDTLYVTMPPYLTLFGMNRKIAFCTNYLSDIVMEGIPVSHMRRDLLRCESIDEAVHYFHGISRATAANFLITDGTQMIDIEVSPFLVRTHDPIIQNSDNYFAHTNHVLEKDIRTDITCSRLAAAVNGLQQNQPIETILSNRSLYVPITHVQTMGFGTIITATMNPKTGVLRYRQNWTDVFQEIVL